MRRSSRSVAIQYNKNKCNPLFLKCIHTLAPHLTPRTTFNAACLVRTSMDTGFELNVDGQRIALPRFGGICVRMEQFESSPRRQNVADDQW